MSPVNAKQFYEEVILPEIPDYHIQSWYKFLRRFKTKNKLVVAEVIEGGPSSIKKQAEDELIAAKGVKHGKLTVTTTGKDLPL